MAKKLKHMKLNGLESEIFESQKRTLNLKLQHLAEEYSQLHDSYGKGLAEMGEQLGVSLDIENYCTVSLFFEQTYL
ncbi:hypothetical protein [Serratia proteamaculans]|uniref:hypothetical protein n=1 Tax=Serratia proteamaculans TaxID=28151 RepID=UPI0039AF012A|nr:hypothetical protein [Salmonella enterica]EKC5142243.1 hypothetical protein [Salmonella enterica]